MYSSDQSCWRHSGIHLEIIKDEDNVKALQENEWRWKCPDKAIQVTQYFEN